MLAGLKRSQACRRGIGQRAVVLGNWLLGPESGEAMGTMSMDASMNEAYKRSKVGMSLFGKWVCLDDGPAAWHECHS